MNTITRNRITTIGGTGIPVITVLWGTRAGAFKACVMLCTFVPIGTPGRVVCVRAISSLRITAVRCAWIVIVARNSWAGAAAIGLANIGFCTDIVIVAWSS